MYYLDRGKKREMDFFIDIIESIAMFLETKAKFFMNTNNKDEYKKRKKYLSITFILVIVSGLLGMIFL